MDIHELIRYMLKNKRASFILDKNSIYLVKIRCEYIYDKKVKSIFMYFYDWDEFLKIYKLIPENQKHFYEIIENESKFFLDLDSTDEKITEKEWIENIKVIKKVLKNIFTELFSQEIVIAQYESILIVDEPKYSCHIVVE